MPKGRLVLHTKYIDERGGIVEMKAYKVPKSIEFRSDPLPLSGALKPVKVDLRAPYWEGHDARVH